MTELDIADAMSKVLDHYGIEHRQGYGNLKIPCPLPGHDDHTPSCSIDTPRGLWCCHGCGRGGGIYHLIEELEGISRELARDRAKAIAGGSLPSLSGTTGGRRNDLPAWASAERGRREDLPDWARRDRPAA